MILTGEIPLGADCAAPGQLTTCRFKQKTVLPLTGDENDVLPFPEDLQWLEVFQS